jgi:hypothetical protein
MLSRLKEIIVDKPVTGEACVDVFDSMLCMEEEIISERLSTARRHRGRPRKRNVRFNLTGQSYWNPSCTEYMLSSEYAASKRPIIHRSPSGTLGLNNVADEYIHSTQTCRIFHFFDIVSYMYSQS